MNLEHHSIHIPQWKKDEIEGIKNKMVSHPVIGLVSTADISARQLQTIRRNLRGVAVLKMSRNSLIERAIDSAGDNNLADLKNYISSQTAVIFTEENPFKLYKILESSKTPAPIKGGTVAPKDIIVEKGPTSFPPGAIVGELQNAGIPAAIDKGKVVIRETKTVAKEGEIVPNSLATMLTKLEIFPRVIGLDLQVIYEKGTFFEPEDLAIDEAAYANDLIKAAQSAFNLSVSTAYPTTATIATILLKAASESRNLAVNGEVVIPEILDVLLGKAYGQMTSLAVKLMEKDAGAVGDELRETVGKQATATEVVAEAAGETTVDEAGSEETEEETEEEGEAGAGLGALFG